MRVGVIDFTWTNRTHFSKLRDVRRFYVHGLSRQRTRLVRIPKMAQGSRSTPSVQKRMLLVDITLPPSPKKKVPPGAMLFDQVLNRYVQQSRPPTSRHPTTLYKLLREEELDITESNIDTHLFSFFCPSLRSLLESLCLWHRRNALLGVNPPPPRPFRSELALGRDTDVMPLNLNPLPLNPCSVPPSPATVSLLFPTRAWRAVPLCRRSGGQRADSMLYRWDVRAGMGFLLPPRLSPARASVPDGGV